MVQERRMTSSWTAFGKGPEYESETAKLQAENRYLKQQIEVLKKYAELERKWSQKLLLS